MNVFLGPIAESSKQIAISTSRTMLVELCCLAMTPACFADDSWPRFCGDGSEVAKANVPTQWSPSEGVAWQSSILGDGQPSPVVWNNNVCVTSSEGPCQQDCQVDAFDLHSGKRLWTSHIEATTKVVNDFRNSLAAPTCCVDQDAIYSFFASGDVTAMSHDGKKLWGLPLLRTYGDVENERGVASSLAQTDDHLFARIDHHGPSYLVAVEKQSGEVAWKTDRGERVPSWSSPVVAKPGDRNIVIASSADTVDAYDAEAGESLWQLGGLQGNHIPSAAVVADEVFVGSTTMYGGATDEERRLDRIAASS